MNLLDDLKQIKKIDPDGALDSIIAFPDQIQDAWQASQKINASTKLRQTKNIIVCGMGGSALGGRIVQSLFENKLKIPLITNTEYSLPAWVNQNTLVIIASYSGNTEETLSCLHEAKKRKAKIFGITTGGKVGEAIKKGLPGFIFQPTKNPLGYPKTAIGYSLGTLLGSLAKLGFINLTDNKFQDTLKEFESIRTTFLPETKQETNPAKKLALFLNDKIGIFVASEHLKGSAWTAKNQINEIAHAYSLFFDLPELDHHLVEAFGNPKLAKNWLAYIFITSQLYHPRVKIRYPITQQIIEKHQTKVFNYHLQAQTSLAQAWEVIQLGGFTSVYLACLNHQDPGPEPWILELKKQLTTHDS